MRYGPLYFPVYIIDLVNIIDLHCSMFIPIFDLCCFLLWENVVCFGFVCKFNQCLVMHKCTVNTPTYSEVCNVYLDG